MLPGVLVVPVTLWGQVLWEKSFSWWDFNQGYHDNQSAGCQHLVSLHLLAGFCLLRGVEAFRPQQSTFPSQL